MNRVNLSFQLLAAFAWALALCGPASAQGDRPAESAEGLKLVSTSDAGAFYVRPGTTLSEYENAELLAAYVTVDETWVKKYNRQAMRSRRLREKDLEDIRTRVADDFWEFFGGDFFGAGLYRETQDDQPSKLVMRPAILDVSLASVNSSGDTLVQNLDSDNSGKMTLVLEIYDAANSELLGRLPRDSTDHDATHGLLLVEAALAHCLPRTGFLGAGDDDASE